MQIAGKDVRSIPISKDFALKIIKLSRKPDRVREALDPRFTNLTESEIEQTLVRLRSLSEYLIRRIALNYHFFPDRKPNKVKHRPKSNMSQNPQTGNLGN